MCLDVLKSEEETEKLLKSKKDKIIAYKVVDKTAKGYESFHFNNCPFHSRKMNRITNFRAMITTNYSYVEYNPYYHLFFCKEGAREHIKGWWGRTNACIVKCEIPKKDITTVGKQDGEIVIVTRAFKIIEEVI